MLSLPVFVLAALAEIAGCYAVWVWARQGASALWLFPGVAGHQSLLALLVKVATTRFLLTDGPRRAW